jgi:hypothetical protein
LAEPRIENKKALGNMPRAFAFSGDLLLLRRPSVVD